MNTVLLVTSTLLVGALAKPVPLSFRSRSPLSARQTTSTNKTWALADMYQGQSFLDQWDFFTAADPTHGLVNYQSQADAVSKKLAVVSGKTLTLAVDDFTTLSAGQNRDSVRISSKKTYNSGLFIADFAAMPAACGTWPAWWSVGPNWPAGGEIDVLEGVDIVNTNKMTLHTNDGCTMDPGQQTGTPAGTACASSGSNNNGCGVTDSDPTSFGKGFNDAQGGVFAHEWIPASGVRIWHFQRSKIPADITSGKPNPDGWGTPVASFPSGPNCNFAQHFTDHVLTIDTTICGDWAGADTVSLTKSGCSTTCADLVANPANFAAAKWQINYIAVYS